MPRPTRMSEGEIQEALVNLPNWELKEDRLQKTFQFADFIEAWGFMSRVALIAQAMDHHPDWSNVYRTVHVALHTHDAGGITALDIALARAMEAQVERSAP